MLPPPHPPPSVLSEAVLFTNCSSGRFPLDFVLIQSQRWSSFPSSLELTSLRNRWDEPSYGSSASSLMRMSQGWTD